MTVTVSTICPAKLNLFLAVGPPDRVDYHPIRTIFQAVSLCDRLSVSFSQAADDKVECNWPDLPADNTMTKALRLLRELVPVPPLSIRLEKDIPAQSGLGGGSSNAAGLLRCINKLRNGDIDHYTLLDVATAVGADVPFFLTGGLAKATGYGEKLVSLPDSLTKYFLVVRPDIGVSTADAYAALDATERPFRDFPINVDDPNEFYNDFERVAPCICGEIAERLRTHGAWNALLSGSGSAVFGEFPDEKTAINAQLRMNREGFEASWVCHSLTTAESTWTTS